MFFPFPQFTFIITITVLCFTLCPLEVNIHAYLTTWLFFLSADLFRQLTRTTPASLLQSRLKNVPSWPRNLSPAKDKRGALVAICTPMLKLVLGQRNTKCVYYTSTKIRKERSLFNMAQRLNAFVKNAVAFLKLIWFINAAIWITAFVNQALWFTIAAKRNNRICKSKSLIYKCGFYV